MLSLGGLVSTHMLGRRTPQQIFNNKIIRFFFERYSNASGIWGDDIIGADAFQNTAANRPADDVTPANRVCLRFSTLPFASQPDINASSMNTTTYDLGLNIALPSSAQYIAGLNYMHFFCFKLDSDSGGAGRVFDDADEGININNDSVSPGFLFMGAAKSDNSLVDGNWHTIILHANATSASAAMTSIYIDGIKQANTDAVTAFGKGWVVNPAEIGAHFNGVSYIEGFNGTVAALGSCHSPTRFERQDISDLHTILKSYVDPTAPLG